MCLRPSSNRRIIAGGSPQPWLRDFQQKVSGEAGAVQIAGIAVLAGSAPVAAVFTALAGMVGVVTALSCLVHIWGNFCWTEHRFIPG